MTKQLEEQAEWRSRHYSPELTNLDSRTRELLENYSKIPSDQVIDHVYAVREKAWAVHPYPCIGSWRFIDLAIGRHALYPEILERMKTGRQTYLDLGCAFAQDLRRLVADGVDGRQCYGSDLRLEFVDMGYELFRDRATLGSEFIAADIFDDPNPLDRLAGSIDIVGASSFFHLFSWDDQVRIARAVVKLMRPRRDSLLIGRQTCTNQPGSQLRRDGSESVWRHDAASWRRMWDEVGAELGLEFQVESKILERGSVRQEPTTEVNVVSMMQFSVRRLA